MTSVTAFSSVALLAFWTVLVAELVGDRAVYALGSLSLRFKPALVFSSFAAASAAKMLAAVWLGSTLLRVPGNWTHLIGGAAFLVSAWLIWWEGLEPAAMDAPSAAPHARALATCLSVFLLSEWLDAGQIAAAALVVRSHLATATWVGATAAILTKGLIALACGVRLRHRLPMRALRVIASASCCVLGLLAVGETFVR